MNKQAQQEKTNCKCMYKEAQTDCTHGCSDRSAIKVSPDYNPEACKGMREKLAREEQML